MLKREFSTCHLSMASLQGMAKALGGPPATLELFHGLLNGPRFGHCALIVETPGDEPSREERNVRTRKRHVVSSR
jgi:hypothetical protein